MVEQHEDVTPAGEGGEVATRWLPGPGPVGLVGVDGMVDQAAEEIKRNDEAVGEEH